MFTRYSKFGLVPVVEGGNMSTCLSERFCRVSYSQGPCSALNLITLQRSSKWKACSECWGHCEVSDWHVDWHHSNVPVPRRIAGFNCPKVSCDEWTSRPGGGNITFTRVHGFSAPQENLMKLLVMLTGCLDQSVNLFATWPPRLISQAEAVTSEAFWAVRAWFTASPLFLSSQSAISKRHVCSSSDVLCSIGCQMTLTLNITLTDGYHFICAWKNL